MEIYNFPQYSDEWWNIRDAKMTASKAAEIGNIGKGLDTYIDDIVATHFSGQRINFSNEHTERGRELESTAGMLYSFEHKIDTQLVGFVVMDEYVGCSPDLLAGDDGLGEIKVLDYKAHYQILKTGNFPKKYRWQAQMQMIVCDKKWCDLISYNPNFQKYLYVQRQYPDSDMVKNLMAGIEKGKEKLIKLIKKGEAEGW
jgi:hypothetical protein